MCSSDLYKAVNKAAPSKGGPRLATLVIRRPSDAADEGDVTMGHSKAPAAPAHRPGWAVDFSALVTPLLPWTAPMDSTFIVHPASSFVAMWYPFPPRYLGDEDRDTYKRRRSPFGQGVVPFQFALWFNTCLAPRSRVSAIVATPSSPSSPCTVNLYKQCNTSTSRT